MKIKLLASNAHKTAIAILNSELPPETNNMDVIEKLCELARIRGIELSFCRESDHGESSPWRISRQDNNREVCFSATEAEIAIERRIAMRPMPKDD